MPSPRTETESPPASPEALAKLEKLILDIRGQMAYTRTTSMQVEKDLGKEELRTEAGALENLEHAKQRLRAIDEKLQRDLARAEAERNRMVEELRFLTLLEYKGIVDPIISAAEALVDASEKGRLFHQKKSTGLSPNELIHAPAFLRDLRTWVVTARQKADDLFAPKP